MKTIDKFNRYLHKLGITQNVDCLYRAGYDYSNDIITCDITVSKDGVLYKPVCKEYYTGKTTSIELCPIVEEDTLQINNKKQIWLNNFKTIRER